MANKLKKYIKASLRAFTKAKDLYFKGVTECTGHVNFSGTGILGLPAPSLPRSYSVSSDCSRTGALNRSSSSRKSVDVVGVSQRRPATVSRSRSVAAIGRIDEDEAFTDSYPNSMKSEFLFPRSRSYAVSKRPYPMN